MSELFDEVDEDVRRDQLKKLWERYSIFIIGAALLIIAAVGGWRGYQYLEAKKAAEAGAAFDKAVELSEENKHAEAEAAFEDLAVHAPSGYRLLARLQANKTELLMVLERPEIPLHNNLSESDIREWAKKRKISAGTRSELGRRCRDTFVSLKKTCRKLGVSFWRYLQDRIRGVHEILVLPELMRQATQET